MQHEQVLQQHNKAIFSKTQRLNYFKTDCMKTLSYIRPLSPVYFIYNVLTGLDE